MKKILSTFLALFMIATSFAALAQTVLATEETGTETGTDQPKDVTVEGYLYNENFNSGFVDNSPLEGMGSIKDGRLSVSNVPYDSYLIFSSDALKSGYTVEFDFQVTSTNSTTAALTFYTADMEAGDYTAYLSDKVDTHLKKGWYASLGADGTVICGARNKDSEVTSTKSNAGAVSFTEEVHVKIAFGQSVGTVGDAPTVSVTFTRKGEQVYTITSGSLAGHTDLLTKNLRVLVPLGTTFAIDDLTITYYDTSNKTQSWDFSLMSPTPTDLSAKPFEKFGDSSTWAELIVDPTFVFPYIGWSATGLKGNTGSFSLAIDWGADNGYDKRLLLGNASVSYVNLITNNKDAKNGFVIEYDVEITDGTGSAFVGVASSNPNSVNTEYEITTSRPHWGSLLGYDKSLLSGEYAADSQSWPEITFTIDETNRVADLTSGGGDYLLEVRLAIRVVFDPSKGLISTYVQLYNVKEGWDEKHLAFSAKMDSSLLSGTVQLVYSSALSFCIDNVTISALEVFPNAYGIQTKNDTSGDDAVGTLRLLGIIDQEIFNDATATEVGFVVTITRTDKTGDNIEEITKTRVISCGNIVYKSITSWNGDSSITPDQLMGGASHFYAFQLTGIKENLMIQFTPYYIKGGVRYEGADSRNIDVTYNAETGITIRVHES